MKFHSEETEHELKMISGLGNKRILRETQLDRGNVPSTSSASGAGGASKGAHSSGSAG